MSLPNQIVSHIGLHRSFSLIETIEGYFDLARIQML